MRVALIHNPKAGRGNLSQEELVTMLEHAGHKVKTGEVLEDAVRDDTDVVIAAGGDGTALTVARQLVSSPVPMVMLPLGTANNFGHSLGMSSDVEELLAILERPLERRFDLGLVSGAFGVRYFCESAGVGWFCDALTDHIDSKDKTLERAQAKLTEYLEGYQPLQWSVSLDEHDASGEYLLVEVLNAGMVGPNMLLGSEANPTDGQLEVVLAAPSSKPVLLEYLARLRRGEKPAPPRLERRRVKSVRIELGSRRIRVDGNTFPKEGEVMAAGMCELSVLPSAVKVWLARHPMPAKEQHLPEEPRPGSQSAAAPKT